MPVRPSRKLTRVQPPRAPGRHQSSVHRELPAGRHRCPPPAHARWAPAALVVVIASAVVVGQASSVSPDRLDTRGTTGTQRVDAADSLLAGRLPTTSAAASRAGAAGTILFGAVPRWSTAPRASLLVRTATQPAAPAAAGAGRSPVGTSSPGSVGTGLKAPLSGLVDRHHVPTGTMTSVVRSFVVDTAWADLQPQPGGPLVHPNDIDRAVAVARAGGYALKLRVRAGIDAPAWAKSLDGAPVPMYYSAATRAHAGQLAGTVGRFWGPRFGAAYADLQTKLAAEYDDVPEVRQTDITRCGTIFAETYLRNTMNRANASALVAAGFTRAADDVCHTQQMAAHQVWKQTLSDLSFNPYTSIGSDASVKQDMPYTLAQMAACRQVLGARCVLENHSLASTRISNANYGAIYAQMKRLGGPFDFQTATDAKIGDAAAVLSWAASNGATSVELPSGYQSWPMSTLVAARARF